MPAFCALERLQRGDLISSERGSYSGVGYLCSTQPRRTLPLQHQGSVWCGVPGGDLLGLWFSTQSRGQPQFPLYPAQTLSPPLRAAPLPSDGSLESGKPAGEGGLLHCYNMEKLSLISVQMKGRHFKAGPCCSYSAWSQVLPQSSCSSL